MFIFPSMYEFIVVIDVFLSVLQDATGRSLVSCILKAYAAVWFFHLRYKMSWSVSYKRYDWQFEAPGSSESKGTTMSSTILVQRLLQIA